MARRVGPTFGPFDIGTVTTPPDPSSLNRGWLRKILGALGIADRLIFQRKNAGDEYEWADVPTLIGPPYGVIPVFNATNHGILIVDDDSESAAETNTATLMRAITDIRETESGAGRLYIPVAGTLSLAAYNEQPGIIILDSDDANIWIEGISPDLTILRVADGQDRQVLGINGADSCVVRNLTIDGNVLGQTFDGDVPALGLHGLSLSGSNHIVDAIRIKNTGGYGIACSQGSTEDDPTSWIKNCRFSNIITQTTGGDGIESKDNNGDNLINSLYNVHVRDYGYYSTEGDKTGFDLSGPWNAVNVSGIDTNIDHANTCFRFRPRATSTGGISSLTNGYFKGPGSGSSALMGEGIALGSEFDKVSNCHIEGFTTGIISQQYGGKSGVVSGVTIENCTTGILVSQDQGGNEYAPTIYHGISIKDCTTAIEIRNDDHLFSDLIIEDCVTAFYFNNFSPNGDAARNQIHKAKIFGDFTRFYNIETNANDNILRAVDVTQATESLSSINNGTGTSIFDCPGITNVNAPGQSAYDVGTLTIASGVITLPSIPAGAQVVRASVDTESAAASDDLDSISVTGTLASGTLLFLRTVSNGRDVTVKHGGASTINLHGATDVTLDTAQDRVSLAYNGTGWNSTAPASLVSSTITNSIIGVKDSTFTIRDDGDTTKALKFQASGISTATTVTLTAPNASGTIRTSVDTVTREKTFGIDGGGVVISTGVQRGDLRFAAAATITKVTLLSDQSGSIVIDIWKDSYANYPPTVADSITASAKPTLSSATKYEDSTLTGWTRSIAAGDTLRFNVDSVTTCTYVTVIIEYTQSL